MSGNLTMQRDAPRTGCPDRELQLVFAFLLTQVGLLRGRFGVYLLPISFFTSDGDEDG
jgi:hypothetical protein